jgi:hypothetical protein
VGGDLSIPITMQLIKMTKSICVELSLQLLYVRILTLPMSINSRWAAEAALTRADVAAAIDFAASRIISSKLKLSSVSLM